MRLDIDKMSLIELKDTLKMIIRVINGQNDSIYDLQARLLALEIKEAKE